MMILRTSWWTVMAGASAFALPVLAAEPPVPGQPPRAAPAPAVALPHAERYLPSTALGFDRGVGPAPGQVVTWRGARYLVVEVAADQDQPTFSGGSRFVITSRGGSLEVGLMALAAPPQLAGAD
jgi:hypothetical protein